MRSILQERIQTMDTERSQQHCVRMHVAPRTERARRGDAGNDDDSVGPCDGPAAAITWIRHTGRAWHKARGCSAMMHM